jgi:hypothetical protein
MRGLLESAGEIAATLAEFCLRAQYSDDGRYSGCLTSLSK